MAFTDLVRVIKNLPKRQARKFTGAQMGRLTAAWVTQPMSIDEELRTQHSLLLARARDCANNNPWVSKYLAMVQDNVVGRGFSYQAAVINERDGKPDKEANTAIEAEYKNYGRLGLSDMSGQMTLNDVDRLMIRTVALDGEVILIKHHLNKEDNPHGYAVSFIDTRRLDVALNKDLGNGRVIRMGVEVDQYWRPQNYYFLPLDGDGRVVRQDKHDVFPANRIYHKFVRVDVRQTRGVPSLAGSLLRLNMLEGYEEAELIAARVAAAKMGFFEFEEGTGGFTGDDVDAAGNTITDAEAGSFERLPRGLTFKAWDPQHPNTAFPDFVKTQLRAFASGVGVSYNKVGNDLQGVNYTSLREGNLTERETWKSWQQWMIDQWKVPHYEDWLEHALLASKIRIGPVALDPNRIDKYRPAVFIGRRWAWVDPMKEAQANSVLYGLRLKSLSSIMREQGDDPETMWQECAADNEKLEELGLTVVMNGGGNNGSNGNDSAGASEEDEDGDSGPEEDNPNGETV